MDSKPIEVAVADLQDDVRRLKRWRAFFATIFVLTVAFYGFNWLVTSVRESQLTVHTSRTGDTLGVSCSSDGPFIVTALAAYGDGESDKRVAPLPLPVVVIDSGGAAIDLTKLKWLDIHGEPADPPKGDIVALVVYPVEAKPRK